MKTKPGSTGAPGPSLRRDYCSEPCYRIRPISHPEKCDCKGCDKDAHGRGRDYAFNNGYLKDSPIASRKSLPGAGDLPFEEEEDQQSAQATPLT